MSKKTRAEIVQEIKDKPPNPEFMALIRSFESATNPYPRLIQLTSESLRKLFDFQMKVLDDRDELCFVHNSMSQYMLKVKRDDLDSVLTKYKRGRMHVLFGHVIAFPILSTN